MYTRLLVLGVLVSLESSNPRYIWKIWFEFMMRLVLVSNQICLKHHLLLVDISEISSKNLNYRVSYYIKL